MTEKQTRYSFNYFRSKAQWKSGNGIKLNNCHPKYRGYCIYRQEDEALGEADQRNSK